MQLVEIVEIHVRFHLSQDKTNQFIVTTVSKTTNQQEMTVAEADLADVAVEDMEETAVVEDLEETDLHERCTKQHVQNVEQNVKFHSNQTEKSQFIVTIASKTINQKAATVVEADLVETVVVEDLVEAAVEPADMAETDVVVEDLEEIDLQERCTRLHVQSVEQNAKFHSNQVEKNQSIVMTASRIINQKDDN